MAANEVVYFHSAEVGAPVLNNAAGSLISVLDACLITGFRPITLTSLSVSGGVATATFAGHGYEADRLVELGGAAVGALNGRKRILLSASGTFTFDATGVADNPAVGGTITCKRSPLGWTKPYSGTSKAVYQRSQVGARACVLRIDDSGSGSAAPEYARAIFLETANVSGVDTYSPPTFPTAITPAGQYWAKGFNSSTAKPWVLIGDGLSFYLLTDHSTYSFSGYNLLTLQGFGDLVANRSGDAYASFLMGPEDTSNSVTAMNGDRSLGASPSGSTMVLLRRSSTIGGACSAYPLTTCNSNPFGSGGPTFPSGVDNGLEIDFPIRVKENNAAFGHPVRGLLPGLGIPLATVAAQLHKVLLDPVVGLGRKMRGVVYGNGYTTGCLLFDETGPWQ